MKKIVSAILVLSIALSMISMKPYPSVDDSKWNNWTDTYWWIIRNIEQVPDVGENRWQSPEETLKLKTGDCEDLCILMMFLVWHKWRMLSALQAVNVDWVTGENLGHMMIAIDAGNQTWDPKKEVGMNLQGIIVLDFSEVWRDPRKVTEITAVFNINEVVSYLRSM